MDNTKIEQAQGFGQSPPMLPAAQTEHLVKQAANVLKQKWDMQCCPQMLNV